MYKPEITMRGFYGIGIYQPKTEVNFAGLCRSAFCFNADFIFTIDKRYKFNVQDTTHTPKHIPLFHYDTFDDFYKHMPAQCDLFGVEMAEGSSKLGNFEHTQRSCYLLGAEDYGLTPEIMKKCDRIIEIPYTSTCLNVASTGSIIMYDRMRTRKKIPSNSSLNKLIKDWEIEL